MILRKVFIENPRTAEHLQFPKKHFGRTGFWSLKKENFPIRCVAYMLKSRPGITPSLPTKGFIAKTYTDASGVHPGRTVEDHCQIVGEIAKSLVRVYPQALQCLFPKGAHLAAACHDIGKISPTFYEKLRQACTLNRPPALDQNIDPSLETAWGGHAGVSQATASALKAPRYVPEILGMHHGFSPQLGGKNAASEIFGGPRWQEERIALINHLKIVLSTDWPHLCSDAQARVVAGLTSVADWIGSGRHFENPQFAWNAATIENAIRESGFIAPTYIQDLDFKSIFGFAPHPAQAQLIETAKAPGLYILEAPMGMGKTEAALYAAYALLKSGQASGVYFALPTQLTSNKIYERFNTFLEQVLAPDCPHRKALLLHGSAWLVETEMGEEGRPGGAWFNQSKRGLLAPFAVGTIDQALMAAMNVKHGFVRAFGLAGKVVILDEVHTYDAYTGTLMDALVRLLRSLQCTVIVLSATLSHARRSILVGSNVSKNDYPLITAVNQDSQVNEVTVTPPDNVHVSVKFVQNAADAVEEVLNRAVNGQQVLWLENTVAEAQERYLDFAARAHDAGVRCGLLHSRFTALDRNAKEAEWVTAFGKDGWPLRGAQGRILVGTQVLEQSLDIDADFLVSKFAPTDMLLQRFGRLWRHAQTPRAKDAVREAWVVAPEMQLAIENPQQAFGPTASVYAPYVLCRSLEAWNDNKNVALPSDIRPLIEATYAPRIERGFLSRWESALENGTPGPRGRKGRLALQQLAMVGLARDSKTLSESHAQTRYSETDSCSVLLLKSLQEDLTNRTTILTLLDGKIVELPHQRHRLSKNEWKTLTGLLVKNMVPVGAHAAPDPLPHDRAKFLGFGHCFYIGDAAFSDDSAFYLAICKTGSPLQGISRVSLNTKFTLNYQSDLGYSYTPI